MSRSGVGQADQALAEILAAIEAGDGIGRGFDTVEDVLAIADVAGAYPLLELRQCLAIASLVIEHDETLHAHPLSQDHALDARALRRRIPVRHRGGAADHDAGAHVETL